MAAKEMYDYLSAVTPDVTSFTLGVSPYDVVPQGSIREAGGKNQVVHTADDDSEERISFSAAPSFRVRIAFETLTEAEAGTLMDVYYDTAKADGMLKTFKWAHPDGHTYVVRFDCDMERVRKRADVYGFAEITLRVLGRINDTP
jgi:hypothetical protein